MVYFAHGGSPFIDQQLGSKHLSGHHLGRQHLDSRHIGGVACDALSLDASADLAAATAAAAATAGGDEAVGGDEAAGARRRKVLCGNLDPALLFAPEQLLRQEVPSAFCRLPRTAQALSVQRKLS